MPDKNLKSKTGNAQVRKVGHTSGTAFGQNDNAQSRGAAKNSGSERTYK